MLYVIYIRSLNMKLHVANVAFISRTNMRLIIVYPFGMISKCKHVNFFIDKNKFNS